MRDDAGRLGACLVQARVVGAGLVRLSLEPPETREPRLALSVSECAEVRVKVAMSVIVGNRLCVVVTYWVLVTPASEDDSVVVVPTELFCVS